MKEVVAVDTGASTCRESRKERITEGRKDEKKGKGGKEGEKKVGENFDKNNNKQKCTYWPGPNKKNICCFTKSNKKKLTN